MLKNVFWSIVLSHKVFYGSFEFFESIYSRLIYDFRCWKSTRLVRKFIDECCYDYIVLLAASHDDVYYFAFILDCFIEDQGLVVDDSKVNWVELAGHYMSL